MVVLPDPARPNCEVFAVVDGPFYRGEGRALFVSQLYARSSAISGVVIVVVDQSACFIQIRRRQRREVSGDHRAAPFFRAFAAASRILSGGQSGYAARNHATAIAPSARSTSVVLKTRR